MSSSSPEIEFTPTSQQSPAPSGAETLEKQEHTYGQILSSSALVGGSSALSILIRILRAKVMAILLGPAGFGLFGLYGSILSLTQTIFEFGINNSGVRQIAASVGTGDHQKIAVTSMALRRTAVLLGVLAGGFLIIFARQVSSVTFGDRQHTGAVMLLSLAVAFQLISEGQGALIQGMRRIVDLAKMGVLGSLFGTIFSIILVYLLRERGVALSLIAVGGTAILTSWWYSRKIRIPSTSVTNLQVLQEVPPLLKLGFAFMASGCLTVGSAYLIRIMVLRRVGLEATGIYQSAWTIGGIYVSFILQAMSADFFPRLTASAKDNTLCNRLVNEQARAGLLLAAPGVLATLTFAPFVIVLFYSAKFHAAVGLLRWICLGSTLQVITWPMVLIAVSKGRQGLYFATQLAWSASSLAQAYLCIRWWGLDGAGIAFFGSYLAFGMIAYPVARSLTGFHWSAASKQTASFFLILIAVVFCGFFFMSTPWATCLGALGTIVGTIYSVRVLSNLVSWEQIPAPLQRLLVLFRIQSRARQ